MELDRQTIERQDFSQARRGYDPDEVDAHLTAIAAAVEELKDRDGGRPEPAPPRSRAPPPSRCG